MDPSNGFGATLIDIDLDTVNGPSNDLPNWLREILDRALNAAGVRLKRKVASDEAIASLQEVESKDIPSPECPICYDPYETMDSKVDNSTEKSGVPADMEENIKNKRLQANLHNDEIIHELRSKTNLNVLSNSEHSNFNDPSMFLPIDQVALSFCRFPQRNLRTLQEPTRDDLLPGYNEIAKEDFKNKSHEELVKNAGHTPVRMPSCGHVFGKSCIIEWLKNNVSCPLCRKEVEESKEKDPIERKEERLRSSITANYNDFEQSIYHLMHYSTDIFNPFRRPFNPTVTPLTDSYIPQILATPSYTLDGNRSQAVGMPDPHLVLPGKLPMSSFPMSAAQTFTFRRNRDVPNVQTRDSTNNNNNNETTTANNTDNNSSSDESLELSSVSSNRSDFDGTNRNSPLGRGGPERARRQPRTHPYIRPQGHE